MRSTEKIREIDFYRQTLPPQMSGSENWEVFNPPVSLSGPAIDLGLST
jgi:hypothetical protein